MLVRWKWKERGPSLQEDMESRAGGQGCPGLEPRSSWAESAVCPEFPLYKPAHAVNGAQSGLGNTVTSFHLI